MHTEALHVVERYRRVETGLQYDVTVEDPKCVCRPLDVAHEDSPGPPRPRKSRRIRLRKQSGLREVLREKIACVHPQRSASGFRSLPWASGIKESTWQFPVIESIHSLALAVMLWPAAIVDLRLLGLVMRRRTVSSVAGQFLPWVWVGFTTMVLSGADLVRIRGRQVLPQPLLPREGRADRGGGLNALIFHKTVFGSVARLG